MNTTTIAIMFAIWVAGFASGYGLRSYRSYRCRKREEHNRLRLARAPRILVPLENIDAGEAERIPWVTKSPPSMVDLEN